MSVATIHSAALVGVDAHLVDVEVAIINSLPGMRTVGLPDAALREGRDRVLLAIRSQKLIGARPSVVVNLAPAELHKSGAGFELAIALGILVCSGIVSREAVADLLVVGELSLHGLVRPVRGVLAVAVLAARTAGVRRLIVPRDNAREAALVEGIPIVPVEHLRELAEGLRGDGPLAVYDPGQEVVAEEESGPLLLDLGDVRGQLQAKRAAEVAAAGSHNLLFVGPPGSGKTMIARRLPGILPPLSREEALSTTTVASAAGLLRSGAGLLRERPFRAPHHTISSAGLVGGYAPPRPGEVSLAHNGVLFLDELAEFSRRALESLREPLEEGLVHIVRGGTRVDFPSRTVLVAATNPCPCGYVGDPVRSCSCSPGTVDRYRGRLSGPLLDRIDLHVEVPRVPVEELARAAPAEGSRVVAERVAAARLRQERRGHGANAQLGERAVREVVTLREKERNVLATAVERLGLSPRAYIRILKVARTIADLAEDDRVALPHVLEAVQYRSLDRSAR